MPVYQFRCEGEKHEKPVPFEWEGYLPLYSDPNPACETCGGPSERVWRGRQYHAHLSEFPLTTRMLTGKPTTYQTLYDWKHAVKEAGYRIADEASWLDEDLGMPVFNWRTKKTEYPNKRTPIGGKGTWF